MKNVESKGGILHAVEPL